MSRRRRFKVDSLSGAQAEARIELPETERRHAGVLRLQPGDEVELFDGERVWRARMGADARTAVLTGAETRRTGDRPRIVLAAAWPKGKRAATLVEKCVELGADEIVPLRCARSVVLKAAAGAGMDRLRRIADEAAKQSGRATVAVIGDERTPSQLLERLPAGAAAALLDPRAEGPLVEFLQDSRRATAWCFLVGPEGGFTPDEIEAARRLGAIAVRLGPHVLRVETAALAACAVAAAVCGAERDVSG
mgnify:CR=1 FL=1